MLKYGLVLLSTLVEKICELAKLWLGMTYSAVGYLAQYWLKGMVLTSPLQDQLVLCVCLWWGWWGGAWGGVWSAQVNETTHYFVQPQAKCTACRATCTFTIKTSPGWLVQYYPEWFAQLLTHIPQKCWVTYHCSMSSISVCPSVLYIILNWKWKLFSRILLFATPWTVQAMEFSRPECWSG